MLAIRLQRTGRHGHAQYRVIVQDSHQSPKSGKVVARLGSYNPHTKENTIDTEKAQHFLEHGAQPSDRVVSLLTREGMKMPKWVKVSEPNTRSTRNPEKLRKNQPATEKPEEKAEEPTADTVEVPAAEASAQEVASAEVVTAEPAAEKVAAEEVAEEKVADEKADVAPEEAADKTA